MENGWRLKNAKNYSIIVGRKGGSLKAKFIR